AVILTIRMIAQTELVPGCERSALGFPVHNLEKGIKRVHVHLSQAAPLVKDLLKIPTFASALFDPIEFLGKTSEIIALKVLTFTSSVAGGLFYIKSLGRKLKIIIPKSCLPGPKLMVHVKADNRSNVRILALNFL